MNTPGNDHILKTPQGRPIGPKNRSQTRLIEALRRSDIVFAVGPAGTGKTFASVMMGLAMLQQRRVNRIVITRPIVQAGEDLGFLPGDMHEKVDPYLRPLYDALDFFLTREKREAYIEKRKIEVIPLAYMRGITMDKAFVILDEAQNATYDQLKMLLTRLGPKTTCVVSGDPGQTDLPNKKSSCLVTAREALAHVRGLSYVEMDPNDVVRHRIVRDLIYAYADFEKSPTDADDLAATGGVGDGASGTPYIAGV